MSVEKLIISGFHSIFSSNDPKGRALFINQRFSACVIITLSGKIRFAFPDTVYFTDSEHAIFIPDGASYKNECIEDAKSLVFNFNSSLSHAFALIPDKAAAHVAYTSIKKALPGESIQEQGAILSALYSLFSHSPVSEKTSCGDRLLSSAIKYMYEIYPDPDAKVSSVSEHLHISEIYLHKLFARRLSVSPHKYLTKIRMEQASVLLAASRPVNEVSALVGYSNAYSFSRAYKNYYGTAPSKM